MPRKANWAAVSAVAAAGSALVALLTFTTSHRPSTPNFPTVPASSQESPSQVSPGPTLVQPAGPPAGCQQAKAAITRYDDTVGSTPYSEQQSASLAVRDIEMAFAGASGVIYGDLEALNHDFIALSSSAGSPAGESLYNAALAQTQKDIQALDTDCNATG